MNSEDQICAEALRGPWRALIVDDGGCVCDEAELRDLDGDVEVVIVRATAMPERDDDGDDDGDPIESMPRSWTGGDQVFSRDGFGDAAEAMITWRQAQAMAAGLNAASLDLCRSPWTCPVHGDREIEREGDREGDYAACLVPGCLRSSDAPNEKVCNCELYVCSGDCCGAGNCSCSLGYGTEVSQ